MKLYGGYLKPYRCIENGVDIDLRKFVHNCGSQRASENATMIRVEECCNRPARFEIL